MRGRVVPPEAWRPDVWHPGGPKSSRAGGGVAARGAVGSGQQATALSPTRSSCRVQLLLAAHHGHPPDPAVLRGAALLHFHVGDVRDPGALHLHGRDGKWVAGPHLRAWAGPGQVLLGRCLPAGPGSPRPGPGLQGCWAFVHTQVFPPCGWRGRSQPERAPQPWGGAPLATSPSVLPAWSCVTAARCQALCWALGRPSRQGPQACRQSGGQRVP